MNLVIAILIFVICSIGAAMNGDFSGLEAIGKFILGVLLFVVAAWIITSGVYIIVLIIIGIVLVVGWVESK